MNETIRMQLSAYVDGELPDSESELLLRRISQDAALRAEVAEFIEIGRAIRGEASVPGVSRLRERVAAALGEEGEVVAESDTPTASPGYRKSFVGIAVAASVALVALIGLQQLGGSEDAAPVPDTAIAADEYVVPPEDPELQRYLRMHGETSSAQGANGMNVRIVSLPTGAEVLEAEPEEALPDDDPAGTDSDSDVIEE